MDIVQHPKIAQLRSECETLREELAKLLVDREHLLKTVLPNIEADYQVKIGHLEYERFRIEVEVRRLRRASQIIQAALNRDEGISAAALEAQLVVEFAEWERRVKARLEEIDRARRRMSALMSAEDSAKLHRLYRKIVKWLHPDLNPDGAASNKAFWMQAVEAYEAGDIAELEAIWLILRDSVPSAEPIPSVADRLGKMKEELKAKINDVLAAIAKIKATTPYTMQSQLADEAWVAERQRVLQESIAELTRQKKQLEQAVKQLLAEAGHG